MVDLVFFCRDNSLSLSQGTEICRARQISGRARSAMVRFTLDVDNSLSYGTAKADDYTWLSTIGQDVLKVWPDEYDNDPENALWRRAIVWDKQDVRGIHDGVKLDCGYEEYTFNYAFAAMYEHIPSGYDRPTKQLIFDGSKQREYDSKRRNFYAAFQYFTHYPKKRRMQTALGISSRLFYEQVEPTIYSIARHMNFLDPQPRSPATSAASAVP